MKNGPFANNTLSAEFAEDGHIVKFSYKKPVAEAVALAGAINESASGVSELVAYENGRALRELQSEKALNEAKLATQGSRDALTPTELAQLQRQKEVIDAQIALRTSQTNLQPSQVTEVNNQASLVEAQIKLLEKQIDLKKKEKELEALDPASPSTD